MWTEHDFPDGLGQRVRRGGHRPGRPLPDARSGRDRGGDLRARRAVAPGPRLRQGDLVRGRPLPRLGAAVHTADRLPAGVQAGNAEFVYLPTGLFGVDAGGGTIISGAVASLLAGIIIARVIQVTRNAEWWRPHPTAGVALDPNAGVDRYSNSPKRGPSRAANAPGDRPMRSGGQAASSASTLVNRSSSAIHASARSASYAPGPSLRRIA